MKFEKPLRGGSRQVRRSIGKTGGTENTGVVDYGIKVLESPRANKRSPTREPVQLTRQTRGANREFNDELIMKADELEKLFLEHQLRGRVNHSISLGKERTAWSPPGHEETYLAGYRGSSRSALFPNDSRGKFYERYMEKRDAKLREEWRTRRAEKEMKLRVLWDCFNRRSAEMRAKLFRPPEGYESIGRARFQVEKLRSFNARTYVPWMQQGRQIGSVHVEAEEEAYEPFELQLYQNNRFPDHDLSFSAPKSTAVPVPRSSHRKQSDFPSASPSGQTEYPISQSSSNASNRQQNKLKRSPAVSKTRTLSQKVSFGGIKSNREDLPPLTKQENPTKRSQSMRRSSAPNSGTVIPLKTAGVKKLENHQGFDDLVGMARRGRKLLV